MMNQQNDYNRHPAQTGFVPVQRPFLFGPPPLLPPPPSYQQSNSDENNRVKTVTSDRTCGLFVLLILLLSILISEAVFHSGLRIGSAACFAAYSLLLYFFMLRGGSKLNWRAALLTLPIGLISLSYGLFESPSTRWITLPVLLVLYALQIVYLTRPDKKVLFDFANLGELCRVALCKPFRYLTAPFEALAGKSGMRRHPVVLYLLLGILLAVPLLLLFLFLFASADEQFAEIAGSVWTWISSHLLTLLTNILFGALIALFLAPLFIVCRAKMNNVPRKVREPAQLNTIILSTALILLLLLVLLFSALQFQQLFLSQAFELTEYAQHARGGFFQMTWASGFLFVIAVFVIRLSKKRGKRLSIAVSVPTFLLCCCSLLILFSAAVRMISYIDAAGLSQKRFLTLWLMGLIALSTLVLMAKILWLPLRSTRWTGIACVCAVCLLSVVNVDRIVAQDHLKQNSGQLDVHYLSGLSCSAAPAVAEEYRQTGDLTRKSQLERVLESYQLQMHRRDGLFAWTWDQPEIERALSVLG